jgi:hypothetical protein
MNRRVLGVVTMVAMTASACMDRATPGAAGEGARWGSPSGDVPARPDESLARVGAVAPLRMSAASDSPAVQGGGVRIPGERKLIRNGEMTLRVKDIGAALKSLRDMVASVGGQTANQSERQNQFGGRTASVTCRIPAERLEEAVDSARTVGTPLALAFTTNDVTAEYFDARVRIGTQKALEQQLVGLLARASNRLSDLLEIERELARVREEIDRLEGRVRLWDNQAAMATLVVTLEEPAPLVAGTGGPLVTLGAAFVESAENFVRSVAGLIAAAGAILPVALLLGVIGWLGRRAWRRRAPAAPAA